MKLKTYMTTYLLFLLILFLCFGIISAYVSRSQLNMQIEKSVREYQTLAQTLFKDIAVISNRNRDFFAQEVDSLIAGYAAFYRGNNITIELVDLSFTESEIVYTNILASLLERNHEHYIHITGLLPEPFEFYQLVYYLNITEQITAMRRVQNNLLLICITFSIVTAFALYFVLATVFKPIITVSKISREIAGGCYAERIHVKGNNELSAMASDFNRMAEKIESQIHMLGEEASGKQRFIDNFAHEIRTPLTSIYGNAEYMQKAIVDEGEIIEITQSIMDKTNHMKRIADSLLQLATLRSYTPVKTEITIPELFTDVAQILDSSVKYHNIKFVHESDADTLQGQEDLIKSLLLNLCFNGIKACSSKFTSMKDAEQPVCLNDGIVSLKSEKQGKDVILSVSDNGTGIPADCISKVTEPFYRTNISGNRNGAGLGLTLCKQIADVHGAEMFIDSSEGIGTTVKILFTTS